MQGLFRRLSFLGAVLLSSYAFSQESSLWLIQEEFVKFGKKDAYEEQQKIWMNAFKGYVSQRGFWRSSSQGWSIYGLQVLEEPQYIYLTALKDECDLGVFLKKRADFEQSLSDYESKQRQTLLSMINFSIWSLHSYLSDCSYSSYGSSILDENNRFARYCIYGITPGNEKIFENHLQTLSQSALAGKITGCWRVWKVLAGADMPKYVVLQMAPSEEELNALKNKTEFILPSFKDILRNQREGTAVFNPQLSISSESQ